MDAHIRIKDLNYPDSTRILRFNDITCQDLKVCVEKIEDRVMTIDIWNGESNNKKWESFYSVDKFFEYINQFNI